MPNDKQPCIWTPDTLHRHFETVLDERQRALDAALRAMDYRLAGMNEFRGTVEDVIKNTPTRKEVVSFLFGAVGLTMAGVTLLISALK